MSSFLGDDACSKSQPCTTGQGDCDDDGDCLDGLRCGHRGSHDPMPPGVVASSDSHTTGQADYCYNPDLGPVEGGSGPRDEMQVALRMHNPEPVVRYVQPSAAVLYRHLFRRARVSTPPLHMFMFAWQACAHP